MNREPQVRVNVEVIRIINIYTDTGKRSVLVVVVFGVLMGR